VDDVVLMAPCNGSHELEDELAHKLWFYPTRFLFQNFQQILRNIPGEETEQL
jgi:hypothetical protein